MNATLPSIACQNAHTLGETLAATRPPLARGDASELIGIARMTGEMFDAFLVSVNENLADGVSSRALGVKLKAGIAAAEETIREYAGLEDVVAKNGLSPHIVEALREARSKIEKTCGELASILDFASTPAAMPSLDNLAEAAKGPFVPLRN